jgi:hypothetical protein
MNLSDAFRRAKTSKTIRLLSLEFSDNDVRNVWLTTSDISSRLNSDTPADRGKKIQNIINQLDQKGWNLTPSNNGPHRKMLRAMLESRLDGDHRLSPNHDFYQKHLTKFLLPETIDEVNSYDLLFNHLNEITEAAESVLNTNLPKIKPYSP